MSADAKNTVRMRPIYEWETEGPPNEFVERLNQLVSFDPAVHIQCGARHCTLSIPEEARHTWSPCLDVRVTDRGEGRSHVFARMGPEPRVWTFFMFGYAASGFPAVLGTVLGLVQLQLGETPWGLAALPVGAAVWLGLYLGSFVGKGLGADQIHQLLAVMEANLSVDAQDLTEETSA